MTDQSLDPLVVCEQEKLHHSMAVQGFGCMIAVNQAGKITYASANTKEFLGLTPEELFAGSFSNALGDFLSSPSSTMDGFRRRRLSHGLVSRTGMDIDVAETTLEDGHRLFEFQPSQAFKPTNLRAANYLNDLLTIPTNDDDLIFLQGRLAQTVRDLVGFEKVMIYRFLEDWSGEVITEIGGEETFDSYIGLRFPASDIPKIARDLYQKTPYRLIADSNADPVAVLSAGEDAAPIDLTYADLRSVSPVHIAYLKNMEVGASLSYPIIVSGRLWGLLALHHPTANTPALEVRNQCATLVTTFTLTMKTYLSTKRMADIDRLERTAMKVVKDLDLTRENGPNIEEVAPRLMSLVNATGGVLVFDGQTYHFGETPSEDAIADLERWFLNQDVDGVYHTDQLSADYPSALAWKGVASGLLAMKFKAVGGASRLRLYWFRPELPEAIHWAGNPHKAVSESKSTLPISPRTSFAKWTETTSTRSAPWSQSEISAAIKVRAMTLSVIAQ